MQKRFWEIDLMKVLAISMMVLFHFVYDLSFFGGHNSLGKWVILARICAATFILLVGINLSYSRRTTKQLVFRGMKIFGLGLVITAITYITFTEYYVRFGILHFIGLSIILAIPFLNKKYFNLMLGWLVIMFGWLTYTQPNFYSFDYVPILPWFGLVLIGLFIGKELYKFDKRLFSLPEPSQNVQKILHLISRNSLLIYFLHQPILIMLLKLLNFV